MASDRAGQDVVAKSAPADRLASGLAGLAQSGRAFDRIEVGKGFAAIGTGDKLVSLRRLLAETTAKGETNADFELRIAD